MNFVPPNADGFALFGLAGFLIWAGVTFIVLLITYWIIRLAVRHALRDHAKSGGRPGGSRDW